MIGFTAKLVVTLTLSTVVSLTAVADDLMSAANDMCEKVKACSLAQIDESDMTPEMRQMMEPMLESMCDQMRQGVQQVPTGHAMYEPAVACMRSMANLSCEDFQDESGGDTAECKKYREIAEKTYKDS